MITETPLKGLKQELKNTNLNYPQCTCGKCFKLFFNMLCCAARMSGKSWCVTSIIRHYETNVIKDDDGNICKVRTFICCPTIEANGQFRTLESVDFENDTYDTCNDDIIDDIVEKIEASKAAFMDYINYKKIYNKYMKLKINQIDQLTDDELSLLVKYDFQHYKELPEKKREVFFIIFDDILGTKALSSSKRSKLMNLYIKNRHLNVCCFVAVQSMKGLSREIRLNSSVFFLGKFANKKIVLEDMFEEISNTITMSDFEKIYDHCTANSKYGSLIVDLTGNEKRFLKGLDAVLEIKP